MFKIFIASLTLLTFSCASQNRTPAQADIGSLKSGSSLNPLAIQQISERALISNWSLTNMKQKPISPNSQFDCSSLTFANTNQALWFRKDFRSYLIEKHNFTEDHATAYAKKVTSFISSKQTVVTHENNGDAHQVERCPNLAELHKYLSQ